MICKHGLHVASEDGHVTSEDGHVTTKDGHVASRHPGRHQPFVEGFKSSVLR